MLFEMCWENYVLKFEFRVLTKVLECLTVSDCWCDLGVKEQWDCLLILTETITFVISAAVEELEESSFTKFKIDSRWWLLTAAERKAVVEAVFESATLSTAMLTLLLEILDDWHAAEFAGSTEITAGDDRSSCSESSLVLLIELMIICDVAPSDFLAEDNNWLL